MSEDTTQVEENETEESQETDKPFDYDPKYAFDANSGLAPQPGGTALPDQGNKDLLIDSEGDLKAVDGNDVTSEAHQAKIDADAEGKSKEETQEAVAATEGATDKATSEAPTVSGDAQAGDTGQASEATTEAAPAEAYDPSDKSVADVKAYVEAHPEEKDAILAAEAGGKNRPTIAAL